MHTTVTSGGIEPVSVDRMLSSENRLYKIACLDIRDPALLARRNRF